MKSDWREGMASEEREARVIRGKPWEALKAEREGGK